MQYALFKYDADVMLLVDIHEHIALTTHCDSLQDIEEDEDSMPLKLVYGSYKPQHRLRDDVSASLENLMGSKGYQLGHVKGEQCRAIEMCDIEAFEPIQRGKAVDIPFAALIRTHIEIPDGSTQAVTGFLRYLSQMNPATNILNRPGLFAFKAQDRRVKVEALTAENWRQYIDQPRAIRAARQSI